MGYAASSIFFGIGRLSDFRNGTHYAPFKMGSRWDYFLDVLIKEITSHNPAPMIGIKLAKINQLGKLPGVVS